MSEIELSVIIPSRNVETKIKDIILSVFQELKDLKAEFIIIDMNSSDSTIFKAFSIMKEHHITGHVIQSGAVPIGTALNMGIFKASGKYITFLFPKRLYKNFIVPYYKTAIDENADFIFSTPPFAENKITAARTNLNNVDGVDLAIGIIKSIVYIDFGAIMLNRAFVINQHIKFLENCPYGYAEAFIFNVLVETPKVSFSSTVVENDTENRAKQEEEDNITAKICFERVEAMLKVFELMKQKCKDQKLLLDIFEHQKIPETIFTCIDILLENGFSYNAIRSSIQLKKYDHLLKFSKVTPHKLRRNIIIWRTTPWMYKPKKG